MKRLIILLVSLLLVTKSVEGQVYKFTIPPKDCNVLERKFDNPFSDHSGWEMRRVYWHMGYALASDVIANEIHYRFKIPVKIATIGTAIGIGLIPHIRGGLIRRDYPINPMDWLFDLNNRSLPIYLDQPNKYLGLGEYIGTYAATVCWSSP